MLNHILRSDLKDMEEMTLIARDGKPIVCHLWDKVDNPKAVVQIIHGIKEYGARYNRFACFLNENGYIVFADDHRSHGKTVPSIEHIGLTEGEKDLFMATVYDELHITQTLSQQYKLPVFIFGHSYGSFLTQRYMQISNMHQTVCLCGSARIPWLLTTVGTLVAVISSIIQSPDGRSELIEKCTFGRYNQKTANGSLWTTRDPEESEKQLNDPYAKNVFSHGFYAAFFNNLRKLYRRKYLNHIDKDIPVLIISGGQDGVSEYGKYATTLYQTYKNLGIKKIYFKLYPEARHELLNELNYQEVQDNILNFYEEALSLNSRSNVT